MSSSALNFFSLLLAKEQSSELFILHAHVAFLPSKRRCHGGGCHGLMGMGGGNGPFCGKGESPNGSPFLDSIIHYSLTILVLHTLHTISFILDAEHGKSHELSLRMQSSFVGH